MDVNHGKEVEESFDKLHKNDRQTDETHVKNAERLFARKSTWNKKQVEKEIEDAQEAACRSEDR